MNVKMNDFGEFAEAGDAWDEAQEAWTAELLGNLILRITRMSADEIEMMAHYAERLLTHRKEAP